jgi:hypothetical protein
VTQIEFGIPPCAVELGEVVCRNLLGVQQGRDNDDDPAAESWLFDLHSRLSYREKFWQRFEGLPINRTNDTGTPPLNDVIALAEAPAASKVSTAMDTEANYGVDSALLKQEDFVPSTHIPVGKHDITGKQDIP